MFSIQRRRMLRMLALAFCAGSWLNATQADSLWQQHNPRRAWLFEDSRARRIGDLITVIIAQSTEVDNSENKNLTKSNGASAKFDFASATGGDIGTSDASGSLEGSNESARNFSGAASYSNTREFQDRITVQVVDIDPAGNLVIAGSRQTLIAGEHRILNIQGIVRKIDIGPDNTLNSQFIFNMRMDYEGAGPERRFTRQGWFSRKMNRYWPF